MSRPKAIAYLGGRVAQLGNYRMQTRNVGYAAMVHAQNTGKNTLVRAMVGKTEQNAVGATRQRDNLTIRDKYGDKSGEDSGDERKHQIWDNLSRKDKKKILLPTLCDLKDSKEAVYGTLDLWVAQEHRFPIGSLKVALAAMEKAEQWHKIVQVIKWMLSKGQGTTMHTYQQLIKALDMDHRPEEAHHFWVRRLGSQLHLVPWRLCIQMISIYKRSNMPEHLVKLFRGLEAIDRKPPEKALVLDVANAYELLGLHREKEWVLEKYNDLFNKKHRYSTKKKKKSDQTASTSDDPSNNDMTAKLFSMYEMIEEGDLSKRRS